MVMSRWSVAILMAGVLLVGCGDDDKGTNAAPGPEPGPGAYQADYRTSSAFYTLMSGMKPGNSPHGRVQIWYSVNVRELLSQSTFRAPPGTVSIKPYDMDADGVEDGVAVMVKKESGYDPTHGDWYYEMRGTNGSLMADPAPGPIAMCVGCHAAASAKDYLAGTALR
jgi:hypothetical protein